MAGRLNRGSRRSLALWRSIAGAGQPGWRRGVAIGIVVGVAVIHGCVADDIAQRMTAFGTDPTLPARIEVAYVREMEIAAPPKVAPVAAPAPAPRPKRRRVTAVAAPASAASEVLAQAPVPEPVPDPVPALPEAAASAPDAVAAASPAPAASAPDAPPFAWPVSTRLSYVLTGNYRGEINGDAQVEWVHVGDRYQVHLDVTVGLPFAPLFTRRMTSDGVLTPQGLVPERYDEDSKVMGSPPRHSTIRFEPDAVVLNDGRRRERWPGLQDAASQFVQLSFLFTTQPQRLATGQVLEVPLALPRNVDRWVYDVREPETLYTPFGAVEAFHLQPRRITRPGGDLTAEIWFAPSLAYLPARIRIRQDADTYIDLMLRRKPQLAAN